MAVVFLNGRCWSRWHPKIEQHPLVLAGRVMQADTCLARRALDNDQVITRPVLIEQALGILAGFLLSFPL